MLISNEQAHNLAVAIYKDIKPFIHEHRDEYEAWLIENGYATEKMCCEAA